MKRVTKGMTSIIIDLCKRNKTEAQENALEADVEEFANRGLRGLAVAFEEVPSGEVEAEGNGFELLGLLAIFDPPRHDTKETLDNAQALGVRVKMVTGDQLAIAKETGRRLGLGDRMFNSKVLVDGVLPAGSPYKSLDEMILDVDGFAGVFPEHKYEIVKRLQGLGHLTAMTGDGANDAPALARANVGVAVEGATDAARGAADIVLTEPGLSTIVEAIRQSRIIFGRMKNYAAYAAAITIRVVVGFALLAFIWKSDFPPFMVLIIAFLNDGSIMTLSLDTVKPALEPQHWDLTELFFCGSLYGLYQVASTLALFAVIYNTTFFEDKFGVTPLHDSPNDPRLHMIMYLQVAILAQALIFVTRSHGFSWMERPSFALMGAFCLAQLISSIIAAYGDWGFTNVHSIEGGWIGIVWVWNIIWYFPMDFVKFFAKFLLRKLRSQKTPAAAHESLSRTTSRADSMYSNRTSFLKRAQRKAGFGGEKKVHMSSNELQRLGSIQAQEASRRLSKSQ